MIIYVVLNLVLSVYCYCLDYHFLLIIIIFCLYHLFKYSKRVFLITLVLICFSVKYYEIKSSPQLITNKYFEVYQVNKSNYYISNSQGNVVLYTDKVLFKGDQIRVNSSIKDVFYIKNEMIFNYKRYLLSQNIHYQVNDDNVKILNEQSIDKSNNNLVNIYYEYLFFLNKNDINPDITEALASMGVMHLVVVSGMHFNFLHALLRKILFLIKHYLVKVIIILVILFYYLYLLNFSPPAFKAFLIILLNYLPIKLGLIDKLSVTLLVMFIINPLQIDGYSFILTFFLGYLLILLPNSIKERKLIFAITIFFGMLPLILSMNYAFSIFSIILIFVFTPIMVLTYFLLALTKIFEVFNPMMENYLSILEQFILKIDEYNIVILMGKLSLQRLIIYYIVFILVIIAIDKRKDFKLLTILLFIVFIYYYLPTIPGFITYLNIGQAECIIIKPMFSDNVMLIDVGQPKKSKTIEYLVVPYLKANKIKRIEQVIISHSDMDHGGGINDLMQSYLVDKVIRDKREIYKYHDYTFINVLYDDFYNNSNDNSIVLYSRINGINYFFSGDIGFIPEKDLLGKLKQFPIDVLKVAHHGSRHATSQAFLRFTNPKIAIIMSGENNMYNHPHDELTKRLANQGIVVYNTSISGTIRINQLFKQNSFTTYE